ELLGVPLQPAALGQARGVQHAAPVAVLPSRRADPQRHARSRTPPARAPSPGRAGPPRPNTCASAQVDRLRSHMRSRFLDLLDERVVVYDGATGTNLQELGLTADDFGGPQFEGCTDILSVTRPDVIAELHESFFRAGCDVVETNSFGAFAIPLGEYGIPERAHEICLASARVAREVADGYGGLVAGSMGPGTKSPSLGQVSFVELRDAYEVMARGLLEGGVDLLITETHFDLLAVKAAVI